MKKVILISALILLFLSITSYSYAQTTTPSLTPTTTPTPTTAYTLPDAGVTTPTILLTSLGISRILFAFLLFSLSTKS